MKSINGKRVLISVVALCAMLFSFAGITFSQEAETLIKCEVKIDFEENVHTSFALAPTVEEARDSAVEEACSLPCADKYKDVQDEAALEKKLEKCVEECAEKAVVMAAACSLKDKLVYTEGAWNTEAKEESKVPASSK